MQRFAKATVLGLIAATLTGLAGCGGSGSGDGGGTTTETLPAVVHVTALSTHYVEVTFAAPAGSAAERPESYVITAPDGTRLTVEDVRLDASRQVATLVTAAQQPVEYMLALAKAAPNQPARPTATPTLEMSFAGSKILEGQLLSATAIDNTHVVLAFSTKLDLASASQITSYLIQLPNLAITGAVVDRDENAVLLTTAAQEDREYTVRIANIALLDNTHKLFDPNYSTATFRGITSLDTVGPELLRAEATSSTSVLLSFSEALDTDAADPLNFAITPADPSDTITPDGVVTAAALTTFNTQVVLSTLPLVAGVQYRVIVRNVKDPARNPIATPVSTPTPGPTPGPVPASDAASALFVFQGQAGLDPGELPRVVGAASTGNTSVVVQFSRPMGDSALNAANYVVVQQNVNPEAGALQVAGAAFGADRTTVILTTRSQNEVVYAVTVVNAKDLTGQPMAPKQIIAGVLLDPTTASFPGTPPVCPPFACTGGAPGLDGSGACAEDDDCCPVPSAGCPNTCQRPVPCSLIDSDGDGVSDNEEQRGWVVTIKLTNGDTIRREVTSDPSLADTDGDGLSDADERNIASDPRSSDTDGDGLSDAEEFNVVFSDPTNQDSDGDGITDNFEVEFFKTDATLADSDGDGLTDSQELFELHRDPRIADLPKQEISVGDVQLQIGEAFTFMDEQGETRTENSTTQTTLQEESERTHEHLNSAVGMFAFEIGLDACQSGTGDCVGVDKFFAGKVVGKASGGAQFTTQNTDSSRVDTQRAFQQSIEKGRELSSTSAVTRQITGARLDAAVTLRNASDVAFALSNVEVTVLTTDPQDRTRFVPVATLLPNSTLTTGQPAVFNLGPLDPARGPILFSNRDVFPNLVEDLMRDPRGMIFQVSNYDITTADGRNFAFGSQPVHDRTAGIVIDFGDERVKEFHVITSAMLNRPRDDFRCAAGDREGMACSGDAECGAVACTDAHCKGGRRDGGNCASDTDCPIACEAGKVIGGFEGFNGVGRTRGLPMDFILQDLLQMRKDRPARILAGPNMTADTQACPQHYCVDGSQMPTSDPKTFCRTDLDCPVGTCRLTEFCDDVQVAPVGTMMLEEHSVVVAAGPNGVLETHPDDVGNDDVVDATPPDGIRVGPDRIVQSIAAGDDVQVIPPGTSGVPEDAVAVTAGENGVLDTVVRDDDVSDVVSGYEVSKTCNADTPQKIIAGPNGIADTEARSGECVVVFGTRPSGRPFLVGDPCMGNADCGDDPISGRHGVCTDDTQVNSCETEVTMCPQVSPDATVVGPGGNGFIDSIPRSDDVLIAPGIPCVSDVECNPGETAIVGRCNGPEIVVRVENRRRGQFRRFWSLLFPDDTQFQTDFGQIRVRPGETLGLAFIQDLDRDGLTATEEFLHGSSDFQRDTDGDGLDDFVEVRVGWDVGVVGQRIRHVFPDPSQRDSDGDGLTDYEESDLHKMFDEFPEIGLTAGRLGEQPDAPLSTDPLLRDTDADGVADGDEVLGYLTGQGVVDPGNVIIAGPNKKADTQACPTHVCVTSLTPMPTPLPGTPTPVPSTPMACRSNRDCPGQVCDLTSACDDIQVVPVGEPVPFFRTVVVAPGPDGILQTDPMQDDRGPTSADANIPGDGWAATSPGFDDVPVVNPGEPVGDPGTVTCKTPADCDGAPCVSGLCLVCRDHTAFPMCGIIKPGFNGQLDSLLNNEALRLGITGDDVLAFGQKLEQTNPLHPDTDEDDIQDGIEQVLGSSPNDPLDTGVFDDLDQDGLTDNQEARLGWLVTTYDVSGNPCASCPRAVASNPRVPDTDNDGIPDYFERHMPCTGNPQLECSTDPTNADTDGDGLTDFDELSADQFAGFTRLIAQFPNFFRGVHVDGSSSKQYGTDPTSADTDGDGLSDSFELLVGWDVTLPGAGTARHVFSDPTKADTDSDGLQDRAECGAAAPPADPVCDGLPRPASALSSGATDPTVADTDGDGRLDGTECSNTTCTSDPLVPDLKVTVTYLYLDIAKGPDDGDNDKSDMYWQLRVQKSNEEFNNPQKEQVISSSSNNCPVDISDCVTCDIFSGNVVPLNRARSFTLRAGQGFFLNGEIDEQSGDADNDCVATGLCCVPLPIGCFPTVQKCATDTDCPVGEHCIGATPVGRTCHITFVRAFSFDELRKGFTAQEIMLGDGDCAVNVVVQIDVD